jgi:4-amino-4-deoxy-L-arabinose transferase-like glycosyltransferase
MRSLFKKNNSALLFSLCLIAILAVGFAVRLYRLGSLPAGLNQDEASEFYEAFSLLHWGIDRNGIFNPVQFISWGSGQNAAYAWLCIPLFALFGTSNMIGRLPMAIVGCASIFVFYRLACSWFGRKKALAFALVLALAPWHIAKSRWALESNLFPDVVLLGVCLLAYYLQTQKPGWLIGAAAVLAFSAYCYGTSYMFLPLFLLPVGITMLIKKQTTWRHALLGCGTFFILVLPILLFVLVNNLGLPEIRTPLFTIPRLYVNRSESISTLLAGNLWGSLAKNGRRLFQFLLGEGDYMPANSIPGGSILCPWLLPLTIWGLLCSLARPVKNEYLMHFWVLAAFLTGLTISPNINRINILWLPVLYYTARGIVTLPKLLPAAGCAAVCVSFCLFCHTYFSEAYQTDVAYAFAFGYQECLSEAETLVDAGGNIYVTSYMNQPYISYLFWDNVSPYEYMQNAEKPNPHDAFETVTSIGSYVFYIPDIPEQAVPGSVFISAPEEADRFPDDQFNKKTIHNYVLIWGK